MTHKKKLCKSYQYHKLLLRIITYTTILTKIEKLPPCHSVFFFSLISTFHFFSVFVWKKKSHRKFCPKNNYNNNLSRNWNSTTTSLVNNFFLLSLFDFTVFFILSAFPAKNKIKKSTSSLIYLVLKFRSYSTIPHKVP